jgi:RNA polymerase sigma factor (sigma-70 family)
MYIGLFNAIETYNPSKSQFITHLYNCIKHECYDRQKEYKPLRYIINSDIVEHKEFITIENIEEAKHFISQIGGSDGELIRMVYIDGLRIKDAASKLGITKYKAYKRIKSVINSLRNSVL